MIRDGMGMGRDGTGRDGTGRKRDETGRDKTGRDGTGHDRTGMGRGQTTRSANRLSAPNDDFGSTARPIAFLTSQTVCFRTEPGLSRGAEPLDGLTPSPFSRTHIWAGDFAVSLSLISGSAIGRGRLSPQRDRYC